MKRFAYVIVENEDDNLGSHCAGCSDPELNTDELNKGGDALDVLLKRGWEPVREIAMNTQAKAASTCVMILLVNERPY